MRMWSESGQPDRLTLRSEVFLFFRLFQFFRPTNRSLGVLPTHRLVRLPSKLDQRGFVSSLPPVAIS